MRETEEADIIFGKVLRDFRVASGRSQEALGFDAGLGRVFISWLENGQRRPTLKTLIALARGLDIPLSVIMAKFESEYLSETKETLHKKIHKPD